MSLKRGVTVIVNPLWKPSHDNADIVSIILGLKVRGTVGEIRKVERMGELTYYIVDFGNEFLMQEWWWEEHELRVY